MAPLRIGRSGWMSIYQIFPANYGFHLSRNHVPFLRNPTTRECQMLRGFNPCGVSLLVYQMAYSNIN
jgi:hypothetical protein